MMEGRDPDQKLAATWTPLGTDVNWGEITRQYVAAPEGQPNFDAEASTEVDDITQERRRLLAGDYTQHEGRRSTAGRRASSCSSAPAAARCTLLQMSGIPEAEDYAGFPVGGSFLVNENPDVATRHLAKAYGKAVGRLAADVGAAPGHPRARRQARASCSARSRPSRPSS